MYQGAPQLINTFSNVAGCKVNLKKSVSLLHKNDKWAGKEARETSPFTTAPNTTKHVGVTLWKNICSDLKLVAGVQGLGPVSTW